ncbi:LysM peptidoglycan-binding domain-containing protein [Brumicola nitratireducens]|uniref:LysM domain-containing protein n=1 Tax=Glaciecola nitratireducens (strain JCM 12485 / KCTC 12276 / FR1064) TaxID=1085623 RepID=G4QKQ9_GLANF|nr:LysM peptidoglycan-binding domain-containing protein [Glaciecola nitratireducens]AEP30362.1 hypothetical protein GNIT_2261 [Glaciecola nitratireducens FR1064]
MHRYSLFIATSLLFLGCSSVSDNNHTPQTITNTQANRAVTLSHIRAYLLIGNIEKAEQLFQGLGHTENNTQTLLILSELKAAQADSLGAQQAFLLAMDNKIASEKPMVSFVLLDYFCTEKMWPAIEGYGRSINSAVISADLKNTQLTTIGQCYFEQDKWQAARYWFEQLDFSGSISPTVYLALAREAVESTQYVRAKDLIEKYDTVKSTVNAHTLWTAFEVYTALNQPQQAIELGKQLRILFPNNSFTRRYILLTKRERIQAMKEDPLPSLTLRSSLPLPLEPKSATNAFHIIKKSETLYQLSKRYGVTTSELMSWNPDIVIDDISIGTEIRITPLR